MIIEIITDCIGSKLEPIRKVFADRFPQDTLEIAVVKGEGFPTPLTQDDFILTVQKRFQWMRSNYDNPDVFAATIQKGYHRLNGLWQLSACVGIAHPMYAMLPVMASSVPVPSTCSREKSKDLSRNMSDILKEKYPDWDKENGSVYELLTGEGESAWLEQPLRHGLRAITSFH